MAFLTDNTSSGLAANAPILYQLLTGAHDNSTTLTGFNVEPHLEYLHGGVGTFNYTKLYSNLATSTTVSTAITTSPYAAVGVLYLTNPTATDITSNISFRGSSDNANYGAGVLTAVLPNDSLTWTPVYQLQQSAVEFNVTLPLTVSAGTTLIIMVITTAYALTTVSPTEQFLSLCISGIRDFMAKGVLVNSQLTTQNSQ
jgi:hypothetical protein